MIFLHCSTLMQTLPTVSPPLSPDTIAWNAACALADELGATAPDASVTAPAPAAPDQPAGAMDADDEEVVLQVENSAAVERGAKISALRKEWGGKGKGGILGDLFNLWLESQRFVTVITSSSRLRRSDCRKSGNETRKPQLQRNPSRNLT